MSALQIAQAVAVFAVLSVVSDLIEARFGQAARWQFFSTVAALGLLLWGYMWWARRRL